MKRILLIAVLFCFMLTIVGCGTTDSGTQEMNLYVAAGLKKPMDVVVEKYEAENDVKINANYGPSGGLYTQIIEEQPCDLFFSADWIYIEKLIEDEKIIDPIKFLNDVVVLVVADSARDKIHSIQDILEVGATVAVADTNAPIGAYTEKGLKAMGVWEKMEEGGLLKARPSTVNQLGIMVEEDQVDAGFIYSSVANLSEMPIIDVISHEYTGEVIFGAGAIEGGNVEIAKDFIEFARENVEEFTKYGWEEVQ